MSEHPSVACADAGPHVYLVTRPVQLLGAWVVAGLPGSGLIATADPEICQRIADLLDRHGLVDVPDNAALLTVWPAPTGPRYLAPRPGRPTRPAEVQP